eukprot:gene17222-26443_t
MAQANSNGVAKDPLSYLEKTTSKARTAKPVGDRVTVAVRVRPVLCGDRYAHSPDGEGDMLQAAVIGDPVNSIVTTNDGKRKKDFAFDYVFTDDQYEIYDCIGKDMLREAFAGYNVCLFAYGQTGSGKTYTVQGLPGAGLPSDMHHNTENEGLLPRLIGDLFRVMQGKMEDPNLNIKVTMSVVEIYNEKCRDLLPTVAQPRGAEPVNLDIKETIDKKIVVAGLAQHTVLGAERVLELLTIANKNRQVAETKMNEASSRSHIIAQLYIVQRYKDPSIDTKDVESLITVVDLAGSERQSKTEAQGTQFTEAKHINHSLLVLGKVLNSFSTDRSGGKKHLPLRDSKLTRLLSESFGGNSKTWMLATASPSLYNWSESQSTLNYASNAKLITNHAKLNQLERALEMKDLKERNAKLETQLDTIKRKTEQMQRQLDKLRRENDLLMDAQGLNGNSALDSSRRIDEEGTKLLSLRDQLKTEVDELAVDDTEILHSARRDYRLSSWMKDSTPVNNMYIGRAKVSLKNIIEQTSKNFKLELSNESGVQVSTKEKATLMVKIYPVDAK